MSNSQLLSEVTRMENDLSGSRLSLGRYQGPAVPVPSLTNNVVVLPSTEEKPTFDVGFHWDSDSDEDAACSSSVDFKVPEVPVKKSKKVTKEKPVWVFKEPRSEDDMKKMGQKKFAREMYKKIRWVVNLYHNWRITRNKNPDVVPILVDLDRPETIEKRMLSYAICHFITEIKKLNG